MVLSPTVDSTAAVRSVRFDSPPHDAQQWAAERTGYDFAAPGGAVEFVSGSPFVPFGPGQFAVPANHQALVSLVEVRAWDLQYLGSGAAIRWTLTKNGSPVPGFADRVSLGEEVIAGGRPWSLAANGTLAGVLTGFPSALCPVGCDYITQQIGGGPFSWVSDFAGALTETEQRWQVRRHGAVGVLCPVLLRAGDQLSLLLTQQGVGGQLNVNLAVMGCLWPVGPIAGLVS